MRNRAKKSFMAPLLVFGTLAAVSVTGCSDPTYSKVDELTCMYDTHTGVLRDQLAPGTKLDDTPDNTEFNFVPTSQRFWNFTKTPSKDAASAGFITMQDATLKTLVVQGEVGFKFYQPNGCKWNTENGRRNFRAGYDGMAFNIEGDPKTPWQQWLLRNFEVNGLTRAAQSIGHVYNWKQLVYDFPSNADENGVVPEGVTAAAGMRSDLEKRLGEALTKQLTTDLADRYFCGPSFSDAKADECPQLQVRITDVSLDESDANAAADFQKIQQQVEATVNAKKAAELMQAGQKAAIDQETAKQAQTKAIKDLQNKAAIEEEQRKQALLEAQKATKQLQSDQAAAETLGACSEAAKLNGGNITPEDCARLLLALKGLSPNVATNGVVLTGK